MIVYGERGFKAEVLPPLRQFWRARGAAGVRLVVTQFSAPRLPGRALP